MNIDHNFNDSIFLMEDICMKKILFSLLTLTVLFSASCGKSNSTNTGSTVGTGSIANPILTGSSTIKDAINNNLFYSTTGSTYQKYSFERVSVTVSDYCSSKYITCNYAKTNLEASWEVGTSSSNLPSLETKKAELNSIVDRASSVDSSMYSYNGVVDIYTTDGKGYRLNFRYPIYANPIQIVDRSNNKYTYLKNAVLY